MKIKTAYKVAIDAIMLQQKTCYPAHAEYERTKDLFEFAKNGHKKWARLDQAKKIMTKLMHEESQMEFGDTPLLDKARERVRDQIDRLAEESVTVEVQNE